MYNLLVAMHWLSGGGHKKSVQEQMQFDITKELSNMKPLRKVSKQQLDIGRCQCTPMNVDHMIVTIETEKTTPSMDGDLQERLQQRRQGEAMIYSNRAITKKRVVPTIFVNLSLSFLTNH